MADGIMTVVDEVSWEKVGTIQWTGTLDKGTWTFIPGASIDDRRARLYEKSIGGLQTANTWLGSLVFRGVDGRAYRGWSGFDGVLSALEKSLTVIGLQIDRSDSQWPSYEESGMPKDIDTGAAEEQKQNWAEYDEADAATELVDFLERNSGDGI